MSSSKSESKGLPIDPPDTASPAHLDDAEVETSVASSTPSSAEVLASLGDGDRRYITRSIKVQRSLAIGGRAADLREPAADAGVSAVPRRHRRRHAPRSGSPRSSRTWRSATTSCTASGTGCTIPRSTRRRWEWDNVCPADQWKHSHNVVHHTWTNVIGRDRDVGYEILRVTEEQPWRPRYLAQPIYNALLAAAVRVGRRDARHRSRSAPARRRASSPTCAASSRGIAPQGRPSSCAKDYVLWPLLAGPCVPAGAAREPDREPHAQPVVVHDHLLRPLPRRRARVHRGADRGRDARALVPAPGPRLVQHRRAARSFTS